MGMNSAILLVTDVPTLPTTVITWAIKEFEDIAACGAGLTVLTNIHQSGKYFGVFPPQFLNDVSHQTIRTTILDFKVMPICKNGEIHTYKKERWHNFG